MLESVEYVKRELGIEYSPTTLTHIRGTIRKDAQKDLEKLKQDQFEFKWQSMQRIKEIEWIIAQQHKLCAHPKATFSSKHKCLQELKDLTIILNNLYDIIPIMDSYNIQNGQFSNEILLSYKSRAFSKHEVEAEQRQNPNTKLPESQPIFGLESRQAFLEDHKYETSGSTDEHQKKT
jgi:hypothetical protein